MVALLSFKSQPYFTKFFHNYALVLVLLSFQGVAAGTANDGYLLIPGGPGAADVYRYLKAE
jgi:hypothetical protein